MEDGCDLAHLVGEFGELLRKDRLHAVGERLVWLVMDFDEQAVSADGHRSAGKWQNLVALAGTVAGVNKDGQVAALFDRGDDGQVQGVPRKIGEGSNAAFAKHDVVVALGEDIFSGHEKFIERGGHAALEKNRLFGAARAFEKRKILHVARANLDDVGVFLDKV